MLFVPAADPTFTMPVIGSQDRTPKPQRFPVDAFCIDRTEVPMTKWSDELCGAREELQCLRDASSIGPVACIDHDQAECYCARSTPGVPKRLPTDSEFLLAALGTDQRVHPWGNEAMPAGAVVGRNFCPQRATTTRDWVCNVDSNSLDLSPQGVIGLDSNGAELTGTCLSTPQGTACVSRVGSDGSDSGLLLSHLLVERTGPGGTMPSLSFRCATSVRVRSQAAV